MEFCTHPHVGINAEPGQVLEVGRGMMEGRYDSVSSLAELYLLCKTNDISL